MKYDLHFSRGSLQILKLSIPHLFAQMLVTTYNTYIILYLEKDVVISTFVIALIVSFQNILQLIFRVPLSQLSQLLGRKPLNVAGHFCYYLSIVVIMVSNNIWIILISSCLLAVGMSCYVPAIMAFIADVAHNNYAELLGRVLFVGDVGILIGAFISYIILDVLSMNFYLLFSMLAILQLFATWFALIFLPEVIDDKDRMKFVLPVKLKLIGHSLANSFRSLRDLSSNYKYRILFFYQFIFAMLEFMFVTYFAVLVVNKGFSRGSVGIIIFSGTFCLLWFKPSLGKLCDKVGYRALKSRILFIISSIFVFIIYINNVYLLILAYSVVILAIYTSYQALAADLSKLSNSSERGVAMGVLGFYMSLGRGISTLLVGAIWKFVGIERIFLFFAAFILTSTLISWIIGKWIDT
ncbi:MAG: MFS transporter [Candidatus Kariarchaeaceae archaeon]|jgi:DHA1 family multidrug resistance protein-like MFS transporter